MKKYKISDFRRDYSEEEDYLGREDELAFVHTLNEADCGNVEYMRVLGDVYSSSGYGVKTDYKKAKYWYRRAADCGDNCALLRLADLYYSYDDRGEPHDYDTAFSLYELAAEEGEIQGMARLGIMYLYGLGCDQDTDCGRHYLKLAAEGGDREACYEYALLLRDDGDDGWVELMKKSAQNSYGRACMELIASFGDKMPDKNYMLYLVQAANDVSLGAIAVNAQLMLADCYMHGKRTVANRGYAQHYYKMAAENGSEEAKAILKKHFNN